MKRIRPNFEARHGRISADTTIDPGCVTLWIYEGQEPDILARLTCAEDVKSVELLCNAAVEVFQEPWEALQEALAEEGVHISDEGCARILESAERRCKKVGGE